MKSDTVLRACAGCGRPFESRTKNHRCCSDCYREWQKSGREEISVPTAIDQRVAVYPDEERQKWMRQRMTAWWERRGL